MQVFIYLKIAKFIKPENFCSYSKVKGSVAGHLGRAEVYTLSYFKNKTEKS